MSMGRVQVRIAAIAVAALLGVAVPGGLAVAQVGAPGAFVGSAADDPGDLALAGAAPAPFLSLQVPVAAASDPDEGAAGNDDSSRFGWKGLITGTPHQELKDAARPLDSPLYFEDPYIQTSVRPLFLYHEFPEESLAGGGHLSVLAIQARIALTERLALIATEDGYTDLEAGGLPEGEGWNDLAAGLKYAIWMDPEHRGIISVGGRWMGSNGSREVFQGIEDEYSFFVTGARGFGKMNCIADLVYRLPADSDDGNEILSWNLHASYPLGFGFVPIVEYHGLVYMSDGERIAVRDGLLDYGNLGAGDVEGSDVHWATVGLRQDLKPDVSLGLGYGFTLQDSDHSDIMEDRIILDLTILY